MRAAATIPTGLLAEIGDLKRIRVAGSPRSLAERFFLGAWSALAAGAPVDAVAASTVEAVLAATRLSGIDVPTLRRAGVAPQRAADVVRQAAREVAAEHGLELIPGDGDPVPPAERPATPAFVLALCDQPRAGATAPGRPRLVLHPPESHGDHCLVVAVHAALLAPVHGADPAACFLAGLAHHLHNAELPDAGFAGETLLGDDLGPIVRACTDHALGQLREPLRERTRRAAAHANEIETPEGRAVVAADVLDRVLEMRFHARSAAFTMEQALDDLELVHAGPLQAYGEQVLEAAGLR